MALHEQSAGASDEWYTPRHVFDAMGKIFHLDVAAPEAYCPARDYCVESITRDSLTTPWSGFVWMNPPFGGRNGLVPWLEKFFAHGNGVALVPDRTSAPWWQDFAPRADMALAVRGKLKFIDALGRPGNSPAQGTTLLAIGVSGVDALCNADRAGLGSRWMSPRTAEQIAQTRFRLSRHGSEPQPRDTTERLQEPRDEHQSPTPLSKTEVQS